LAAVAAGVVTSRERLATSMAVVRKIARIACLLRLENVRDKANAKSIAAAFR
jgi:hypothetical protein